MGRLAGTRILVTRPRETAASLCAALEKEGAVPIVLPTIAVEPVPDRAPIEESLRRLERYDWVVFTSANGVTFFWELLQAVRGTLPPGPQVVAVGPATARALAARGASVAALPNENRGARIAEALGPLDGKRVLLPRAAAGRPETADTLRARGALVDDVAIYRTVTAAPDPASLEEVRRGVDVVTFTSPSTVRGFLEILGPEAGTVLERAVVACIGPTTAGAARELGLSVHVEPAESSADGLVAALARARAGRGERDAKEPTERT